VGWFKMRLIFMKPMRLLFLLVVLALGGLSACKKCYACTFASGNNASYCLNDPYTSAQLQSLDTACVLAGGVWTRSNI
jgi:hypothetical protein